MCGFSLFQLKKTGFELALPVNTIKNRQAAENHICITFYLFRVLAESPLFQRDSAILALSKRLH